MRGLEVKANRELRKTLEQGRSEIRFAFEEDPVSSARRGRGWEAQVGASPAASSCNLAVPARAGRSREVYLAAKSPTANEPRVVRAIFSSPSIGPLIAAPGSRQAAMEMLNTTAGNSVLVPARASCLPACSLDDVAATAGRGPVCSPHRCCGTWGRPAPLWALEGERGQRGRWRPSSCSNPCWARGARLQNALTLLGASVSHLFKKILT